MEAPHPALVALLSQSELAKKIREAHRGLWPEGVPTEYTVRQDVMGDVTVKFASPIHQDPRAVARQRANPGRKQRAE